MGNILGPSVARKLVMSLAGLFLILFLIVHLSINLMLLKDDPEPFTMAAHFMATFPLIKIFEIVLIGGFLVHIIWGIILQLQNWFARPVRYKKYHYSQTSYFANFMIWTGGIILIFLFIHFLNFWFVRLGLVSGDPDNFYTMAHELFKIPGYLILYLLSFVILGIHLHHAFQSAFQTLGLNHPKYTPAIKVIGLIYCIIVPAGFASIALIIFFK